MIAAGADAGGPQAGGALRVALLGAYPLDPTRVRGGVQAAFACLVSGLAELEGVEVHVLAAPAAGYAGPQDWQQGKAHIHLLEPCPRFERLRNYRNYQAIILKKLAQIAPHIVHAQEAGVEARAALRSGLPAVVTVHGIRYEDAKRAGAWNGRLRLLFDSLLVERDVIRRTRCLIAISRYVTDYFAGRLAPGVRCFYIPNAVDGRFFDLDAAAGDPPTVLFAGRVTALKGVLQLVRAFEAVAAQAPEARLQIAGECRTDAGYAEQVRAAIRVAGLEGRVDLLGELDQPAILAAYRNCALLASASLQENAPMVIAQAMAAGKPVAATRVGGVSEMVGADCARGLLAAPGDVPALAQAMLALLQDGARRQSMGRAARAFARQAYHPQQVAARTGEVYRQIIAEQGTRHRG